MLKSCKAQRISTGVLFFALLCLTCVAVKWNLIGFLWAGNGVKWTFAHFAGKTGVKVTSLLRTPLASSKSDEVYFVRLCPEPG